MYPELFEIPLIRWPVPTYGVMIVAGFLCAVFVIRRLSRDMTPDPQYIYNGAMYALIAGVLGSRLFYVVHHHEQFHGRLLSAFAVWQGGLELLGGALLAIAVILFYLWYHKLPIRRYLDIAAIGLPLALGFGRIGCFLKGDCFGRPAELPWAVRFPYASDVYRSQVYPNLKRNRAEAQLELPAEFFEIRNGFEYLKPYDSLTEQQKQAVTTGAYRCLPVHPTQLYSSANAFLLCVVLYFFWRRARRAAQANGRTKLFAKPGCTFALMFILYGVARFFIEYVRDDNPFEYGWLMVYKGGTISQNLSLYLVLLGVVLMVVFEKIKGDRVSVTTEQ